MTNRAELVLAVCLRSDVLHAIFGRYLGVAERDGVITRQLVVLPNAGGKTVMLGGELLALTLQLGELAEENLSSVIFIAELLAYAALLLGRLVL